MTPGNNIHWIAISITLHMAH